MTVFTRKYSVRYSEIGSNGHLKIINILNYLQDTASFHASDLKISGIDLFKKGLGWVIYRYEIKILKYPNWDDTISIDTWRYPSKNLYEQRAFEIRDQHGEILVKARSTWILIDLARKKPVRLMGNLPDGIPVHEDRISDVFQRIPQVDDEETRRSFRIRMHDLDLNRHVNNAVFVGWAVETMPENILGGHEPARIDVMFLSEAVYGDSITCITQAVKRSQEPVFAHSIMKGENVELARVRSVWGKFDR